MTIFTVALVVVSGLVLSPNVRDSWGGWVGRVVDWVGPGHYVITPTHVEIELGFDNNLATVCWIVAGRGVICRCSCVYRDRRGGGVTLYYYPLNNTILYS